MRKRTDFFRIEMLALKSLTRGDRYGYEISQEIARRTGNFFRLREGILYPVLYRLEDNGYISSTKKNTSVRQVKVYYHLEEKGRTYLDTLYDYYRRSVACIDQYMAEEE